MKKRRIVFVTDCVDVAANEIRATLIAELNKLKQECEVEIEPMVAAQEFSIINGSFLVRLMAEIYPPEETIFLIILNPLNTDRKDRARIIGETKNGFKFVGANTGTLSWLFKDFGIKEIYESSTKGLDGKEFISFGGKYIHAPIAAKVASGIPLDQLGKKFSKEKLTHLNFKEGTVLYIDNFGVSKFFGNLGDLVEGNRVKVSINNVFKCEAVFTNSMKNLPDQTWAIYPGSSLSLPELGKVRGNGSKELNIKVGDIITFKKES
jgi:S-adenosylmethionine hydrolase